MSFVLTAGVTLLTALLYAIVVTIVGWARWRYRIKAPATTGHPTFERALRVQGNTLEQMPIFLPSLWLAAIFVSDQVAAAIGLAFIASRIVYTAIYLRTPEYRGIGYAPGALCLVTLWVLAVWGLARVAL